MFILSMAVSNLELGRMVNAIASSVKRRHVIQLSVSNNSLGGGINPEAFENGLSLKPDVISVDAGSTD